MTVKQPMLIKNLIVESTKKEHDGLKVTLSYVDIEEGIIEIKRFYNQDYIVVCITDIENETNNYRLKMPISKEFPADTFDGMIDYLYGQNILKGWS